MADGATHFRASVATTIIVAPIAYYTLVPDVATALVAGTIIGWIVSPDVRDIQNKTYPSFFISRIPFIGPFLEILFLVFWFPLAVIIPHRSKLSHFPFLGTMIAYLYAICYALLIVRTVTLQEVNFAYVIMSCLSSAYGIAIYLGWCIPDILHWLMDGTPFGRVRFRKPAGKTNPLDFPRPNLALIPVRSDVNPRVMAVREKILSLMLIGF